MIIGSVLLLTVGGTLLAMYLLGTGEGLPRGNAMKNVVLGVANGVAASGFVVLTDVAWSAALPLALGFLVGEHDPAAFGATAQGCTATTGGVIGWNDQQEFETDDFGEQVRIALQSIVAILAEAGARPEHLVRLTWYVTDKQEYLSALKQIGQAYKDVIGRHYPAMALVQVVALVEDRAKVEIEAAQQADLTRAFADDHRRRQESLRIKADRKSVV